MLQDSSPARTVEDCLKAVLLLEACGVSPTMTALANCLRVSEPVAISMVTELAEHDLVSFEPYQPVSVTSAGRLVALEALRHQRLLALLLDSATPEWKRIREEAAGLDHCIATALDRLVARPAA